MTKTPCDFFPKEAAETYDQRNSSLEAISNTLHFLTGLVLKDLPARSRILCVGAGTGAEILYLAKIYPEWTFVALDPSEGMLGVCRRRIKDAGLSQRCEFFHGYLQDYPEGSNFEAVLAVLVGHFIASEEKSDFYRGMESRLKKDGGFVNVEISYDLDSEEFPSMLKNWKEIQTLMGATGDSLTKVPDVLKNVLSVEPPGKVEEFIRAAGINTPISFFQAFMIHAWHGIK